MFLSVNWVVVDWNGDNMRLNNEWIWDLDWIMDWERHFHFLDDWDLDLLVHWILFDVVMVNSMNMIWNGDLDVFTANKRRAFNNESASHELK
jgi:hypothetical protein